LRYLYKLQFVAAFLHLEDVDALIFEIAAGIVRDLADGGFEIDRVQGVDYRLHLSIIRIINSWRCSYFIALLLPEHDTDEYHYPSGH